MRYQKRFTTNYELIRAGLGVKRPSVINFQYENTTEVQFLLTLCGLHWRVESDDLCDVTCAWPVPYRKGGNRELSQIFNLKPQSAIENSIFNRFRSALVDSCNS